MEEREFHKGTSQLSKKATKNAARLPRTAGLRTITELTAELTRAGYDPSRIEERAKMLAKIQGSKRRREDVSEGDDVDMDSADGASEDEAMEVDGAHKSAKRAKTTSGRVTTKRVPASDRQMTGLKNEQQLTKARELHKFAQRPRNAMAKAGEADRVIKTKLVSRLPRLTHPHFKLTLHLPSQNIFSPESARVEKRTDDDRTRQRSRPAPCIHLPVAALYHCSVWFLLTLVYFYGLLVGTRSPTPRWSEHTDSRHTFG
jgi:hypothetical protein